MKRPRNLSLLSSSLVTWVSSLQKPAFKSTSTIRQIILLHKKSCLLFLNEHWQLIDTTLVYYQSEADLPKLSFSHHLMRLVFNLLSFSYLFVWFPRNPEENFGGLWLILTEIIISASL